MPFKNICDKRKWMKEYKLRYPEKHKAWADKHAEKNKNKTEPLRQERDLERQRRRDIASLVWVCDRLRKKLSPKTHKCGFCGKICDDSEWYRGQHKPCILKKNKIWRNNGGRKIIASSQKARMQYDPAFLCRIRIRGRIAKAIRLHGRGAHLDGSSIRYLGCTAKQASAYIESQFKKHMTWNNYGKVWHIDHVIPLSSFDLADEQHRLKAFHYTNLQPLDAKENMQKGCKIYGHHQSLLIL